MILSPEPSAAEATVTVAPATNDPASAATRIMAATRFLIVVACAFIERPFNLSGLSASIRGGASAAHLAVPVCNRSIRTSTHIG